MNDAVVPTGGDNPPLHPMAQQAAIDRIQLALAEDQVRFDQVDSLFEKVYAATTQAEIDTALNGLPVPAQPPPPVDTRHFAPASSFSLIGDVKIGGWLAVGPAIEVTSVIGDAVVDVSAAAIGPEGLDLTVRSLIGDVRVIVPDGARVQSSVTTIIGDRKEGLVQPVAGGPMIRVKVINIIGDVRTYSLSAVPEGALRRAWAALRRATKG